MVNPDAPISAAASSSSFPWAFKTGIISLETNGNVTNIVASTTPGIANVIRTFVSKNSLNARIAGYIQPRWPNVIKYASPTITGEMENGISMMVARICFPLNENLVRSQAAQIPKKVFTTTAMTVAISVTLNADNTYSVVIALM